MYFCLHHWGCLLWKKIREFCPHAFQGTRDVLLSKLWILGKSLLSLLLRYAHLFLWSVFQNAGELFGQTKFLSLTCFPSATILQNNKPGMRDSYMSLYMHIFHKIMVYWMSKLTEVKNECKFLHTLIWIIIQTQVCKYFNICFWSAFFGSILPFILKLEKKDCRLPSIFSHQLASIYDSKYARVVLIFGQFCFM